MRNYHEVLRNDLYKVLTPRLEAGDLAGFASAWRDYTAAIAVHAAMEDGVEGAGRGTVAVLDHYFGGAAQAAKFLAEHAQEHDEQAAVTAAVEHGIDGLRAAFSTYCRTAEAHLVSEEEVLQPLVAQLPAPKAPKFAE
jgi:ribosomal protein L10